MFSHETARGTVGLTPNKYTYIFTCALYSVLFELVPTSAENIFKSFRVAILILATLCLYKPPVYSYFHVSQKEILTRG